MKILVDTHSHTIASTHAYSTVNEYFVEAKRKGMQMFSLTDHGPQMPDSPHPWHFGNRNVIPRIIDGVACLKGIEANILPPEGGLDVPEGMKPFLDFVIASFHEPVFPPGTQAVNTQAVINTIASGDCQIIGHPGNPNFPLDYEAVILAAKEHNVVPEINNSSFIQSRQGSEPNCIRILELVDKHDWKVVFSSDAHIAYNLGNYEQCITHAQSIGFPIERIINRDAKTYLAFLAEHNKPVSTELAQWCETL
ncbi:phosphatase [Aliiglaciecola sp. 3_MG-2023]|uniref:phosphatase n=1 Tax=Aliiglaciecola sp. 3_MG-2023 TaxID=3062644 RepID=UPI0026E2FFA5|nr:phosphatase [Aliiglaciecola sp. 3_MG-2023]MDO6695240.1 phosphatase [Aliiglaciecola sp. 3_MG-2023]